MILPFKDKKPRVHPSAFIAPGAHIVGDVRIDDHASVWFGAVLRGDMGAIRIGSSSNIQDGCVLHGDHDIPVILKEGVIMGHQATAHACTIEKGVLVGIGARILTGAHVGAFSLIAAGAVVLENAKIPPGSLVLGVPGKVVRQLTQAEAEHHVAQAKRYVEYAAAYKEYLG